MIKNRDFLLSELFGRQALNFDERANRFSHRTSQLYRNKATSQKSVWAEKRGLFLFSMY